MHSLPRRILLQETQRSMNSADHLVAVTVNTFCPNPSSLQPHPLTLKSRSGSALSNTNTQSADQKNGTQDLVVLLRCRCEKSNGATNSFFLGVGVTGV